MAKYSELSAAEKEAYLKNQKVLRDLRLSRETPEEKLERLAKRRAYRATIRDKIQEQNRRYRAANEEYFKQYSLNHRSALYQGKRNRRTSNPEKYRQKDREYYQWHLDIVRAKDARHRAKFRIPYVYICRNAENRVIYVGRGIFNKRIAHHKLKSSWWPEVTNIKKRRCESWADSLVLEALFIRKYLPKYNKEGVII